jgi:hypothetical protein
MIIDEQAHVPAQTLFMIMGLPGGYARGWAWVYAVRRRSAETCV